MVDFSTQAVQIEGILKEIGGTLNAIKRPTISLTLDYLRSEVGKNRRVVFIEREGVASFYAKISPREPIRNGGVRTLVNKTGMSEDMANHVLDLIHKLSEINDIGEWPLYEMPGNGQALVDGRLGHLDDGTEQSMFRPIHQQLEGVLRNITLIRTVANVPVGSRSKYWFYFYDQEGNQVAAINQGRLRKTAWDYIQGTAGNEDAVKFRLARWAAQLQTSIGGMLKVASAMTALNTFAYPEIIELK